MYAIQDSTNNEYVVSAYPLATTSDINGNYAETDSQAKSQEVADFMNDFYGAANRFGVISSPRPH
jgi:hypothetical protein